MSGPSRHTEWLSLVDVSGAFLALPVLEKAFPQGLDIIETPRRQHLRAAYEEWRDAVDEGDPLLPELHREWIRLVFTEILEYDSETLKAEADDGSSYIVASPERTETFSPDWVVVSPSDTKPRIFVSLQSPGTDLEKVRKDDRWPVSLRDRMTALCRVHGVRLGLLTNGERWMLVNAPSGATSGDASWYARLWFQEPVTLKAFQSLLGVRRCFGPSDETLDALLAESLEHHEEITDTLGAQVRRAVEVLVQCLDKADTDRNRELLRDVSPSELYEAGLTVMMRLVFVLCAEERGLLLSGDPVYDECYAVSTLRGQLAEEADRHGPEVLERRHDAWARLLSVFRAVHGGIDHESLRMPALGGSLFDPDRFPFLEGRQKGTTWRDSDATPLPIDNRTVLLLLNSLQSIEQYGGALLLSYRALDVEQIGHVYEGLLEHTVARVPSVTLGLAGSKGAKNPNLTLSELESACMDGEETLVSLIIETTGRSRSAIGNALARPVEEAAFGLLLSVCGGEATLAERIRPFTNLLRTDAWGDPIVYRDNAFMVTLGADRRETGTHYTPKSLTESIVETTLEPVVYVGPVEGKPRDEWRLKAPGELLDLKICDPAMGSGAFLVQVCRWLAERLVEAWTAKESAGKFITVDGDVLEAAGKADPMPTDMEERLIIAKRLIAERCLYGVDINPLAVELAKLSIWLVTLAKGRPFGFLDHNLRDGDSLLGIHRLDQLTTLKMNPDDGPCQQNIFSQSVTDAVAEAVEIRKRLRAVPIRDVCDVETMAQLNSEAREKLQAVELVADAMIGEVLRSNGNTHIIDSALGILAMQAGAFLNGDVKLGAAIAKGAVASLSVDLPKYKLPRKPFHWPLEFPEVFARTNSGFDSMLGNPPFMFGKNVTLNMGRSYNAYLINLNTDANKNVDLCAHFFVRVYNLISVGRCFAMLASSSISEGVTGNASLGKICSIGGSIFQARTKIKWPGRAAVYVATVGIFKGRWLSQKMLDGNPVSEISPLLTDEEGCKLEPLVSNDGLAFVGVIPNGSGLFLCEDEYRSLIAKDDKFKDVLFPYITGEDLNASTRRQRRYIINFWDWPMARSRQYQDVFKIVEERVKPHRATLSDVKKRAKEKWWLYEASAKNMFHAIGKSGFFIKKPKGQFRSLSQAIAIARISKTAAFTFVPTDAIYAAEVVIIANDDYGLFAVLQSSIHVAFAWNWAGKMKTDLRYSPTLCFATFPFPPIDDHLRTAGERFYSSRQQLLESRAIGLTDLYGRFHDPRYEDTDLLAIRGLIRGIDLQVIKAYGWGDINLDHGFHEVAYLPENDRVRFTISEAARLETLGRLSHLNRDRHELQSKTIAVE